MPALKASKLYGAVSLEGPSPKQNYIILKNLQYTLLHKKPYSYEN